MRERSCRKGREELREWICTGFGCLYILRKHLPPAPLTRVCLLRLGAAGSQPQSGCGEQREGEMGPCFYSQQRNKEQHTKSKKQKSTES